MKTSLQEVGSGTASEIRSKLSAWERAKLRIAGLFGRNDSHPAAAVPTGGLPLSPPGPAAIITQRRAAEAAQGEGLPRQPEPRPGMHARLATDVLTRCVTQKVPAPESEQQLAAAELRQRGFTVQGSCVSASRAKFDALSHDGRNQFLRSGGSLREATTAPITEAAAKRSVADSRPSLANSESFGKFAFEGTEKLFALVHSHNATETDLKRYRAELEHRGYTLEVTPAAGSWDKPTTRIVMSAEDFRALPHSTRNAFMANGGKLQGDVVDERRRRLDRENPLTVSQNRLMIFPIQPPPGPSAREYMNWSDEKVKALAERTAAKETGGLERQHLWDAFSSLSQASWQYKDTGITPSEFYKKFQLPMHYCGLWNVRESPNDPAPPLNPLQMSAADYLALPAAVIERIRQQLWMAGEGRIQRAELKRATELAPASFQSALVTVFEKSLTDAYPEEWVWPVGYKRQA